MRQHFVHDNARLMKFTKALHEIEHHLLTRINYLKY